MTAAVRRAGPRTRIRVYAVLPVLSGPLTLVQIPKETGALIGVEYLFEPDVLVEVEATAVADWSLPPSPCPGRTDDCPLCLLGPRCRRRV